MWEFSAISLVGIAGVIDEDFLGGDVDAHRRLESLDIKRAVGPLELHQVQRGEIAGGVVEEDIFASTDWCVDRLGAFAGVPLLDGAIELHARVAADPGAFGDLVEQCARHPSSRSGLPSVTRGPPFLARRSRPA